MCDFICIIRVFFSLYSFSFHLNKHRACVALFVLLEPFFSLYSFSFHLNKHRACVALFVHIRAFFSLYSFSFPSNKYRVCVNLFVHTRAMCLIFKETRIPFPRLCKEEDIFGNVLESSRNHSAF